MVAFTFHSQANEQDGHNATPCQQHEATIPAIEINRITQNDIGRHGTTQIPEQPGESRRGAGPHRRQLSATGRGER